MDEYVATVLMEGEQEPTELKSFGDTPEEIVDNMVLLPSVDYLYYIIRIKDEKFWDFETELEPLREIRKMIEETGGEVALKLSITEDTDENKTIH